MWLAFAASEGNQVGGDKAKDTRVDTPERSQNSVNHQLAVGACVVHVFVLFIILHESIVFDVIISSTELH
jgi:hypothetical protein